MERTGKPGRPISPETVMIRNVLGLKQGDKIPNRFRGKKLADVIELVKTQATAKPELKVAPKPPTIAKARSRGRKRGRPAGKAQTTTQAPAARIAQAGDKMTLVNTIVATSKVGDGFIVEEKPLEYNEAFLASRTRTTMQAGKDMASLSAVTVDIITLSNGPKEYWVLVGKLAAQKKAEIAVPEVAPVAVAQPQAETLPVAPPPPVG